MSNYEIHHMVFTKHFNWVLGVERYFRSFQSTTNSQKIVISMTGERPVSLLDFFVMVLDESQQEPITLR